MEEKNANHACMNEQSFPPFHVALNSYKQTLSIFYFLLVYKFFYFFSFIYIELLQNPRHIVLHRIHRKPQILPDFLVCPVAAGEHGNGKFHRGQEIGYGFLHLRIVDFHPAAAEGEHAVHQFFVDLRLLFADTRFQYALQESVVFDKWFQKLVFSRHLPGI